MPIDPSIILGVKPAQFQQQDPMEQYSKSLALKNLMQQGDLQGIQTQAAQRGLEDENIIRDAFKESDPALRRAKLMSGGQYKQLQSMDAADLDARAKNAAIGKDEAAAGNSRFQTQMAQLQHGASLLGRVADEQSLDTALRFGAVNGIFKPEAVENIRGVVAAKGFSPQLMQQFAAAGLKESERLKAENDAATLAQTITRDTNTNQRGIESNLTAQRGQDLTAKVAREGQGVTMRGQNMGDARARDRLEFDQSQPKGVFDAERGLLVDPRTGEARPVTMGGEQIGPKDKPKKDIPGSALTGMMENNRSLNKVNQAIAAVTGKQAGVPDGMTADKDATGFKGYLPNAVLNRFDPKGTDTRALIADIGSLKIHDRSGAAVTAAEQPRLMPFIPLATDNAVTVAKKLGNFKREYELMQKETGDYYSAENGFKPYKPADAPVGAKAPVKIQGDAEYNKLPPGAVYIGPDGVTRTK